MGIQPTFERHHREREKQRALDVLRAMLRDVRLEAFDALRQPLGSSASADDSAQCTVVSAVCGFGVREMI